MRRDWKFIGAIAALTIIAVVRVGSTNRVFSETLDEPVHVAAGYHWLTERDYRMDLNHPPLARILFALPLRLAGIPKPPPINDVEQGNFLFYYGDRYEKNLARARHGNLVLLIVAIVAIALWTRRTFSPGVAILAVAMFTTLPPILGHAGQATTDLAIAAAMPLALLAFERFLERRTLKHAVWLGVTLAIGVLMKFSFIVFFPVCAAVVWLVKRYPLPRVSHVFAIAATAFFVIWAGYKFDVARPVEAEKTASFYLQMSVPGPLRPFMHWVATSVPLPAPALPIGIALVKVHDMSGHLTYLLGQQNAEGWWYYFPVVFFYKTPIPFMILAAWGMFLAIRRRIGIEHALMPVAIMLVAMTTSINIGLRHLLPIYVSLSILAAFAVVEIWRNAKDAFGRLTLLALLGWLFIGVAADHPDYLAWYNEAAGPTPSRIAVDSNLDWGQDVLRLERAVREMKIDFVWIAYSTNARFEHHAIRGDGLPPFRKVHGWVAIGETPLRMAEQEGGYDWLNIYRPVRRIGKSIRLYKIP